jgi:dihydrofolate reductase
MLVRSMASSGLIDGYRLLVYPVILGSGKRLFNDDFKIDLKLVESKIFSSGVNLLRYQIDVNNNS